MMTSRTCILGSTHIAQDMTTVFICSLIEVEASLLHLRMYNLLFKFRHHCFTSEYTLLLKLRHHCFTSEYTLLFKKVRLNVYANSRNQDWLAWEWGHRLAMTFHFKVAIPYSRKYWQSLNLAVWPQTRHKNIHIWRCCLSTVLHERWSQCRLARQSPLVAALTVRMNIAMESYEVELC